MDDMPQTKSSATADAGTKEKEIAFSESRALGIALTGMQQSLHFQQAYVEKYLL